MPEKFTIVPHADYDHGYIVAIGPAAPAKSRCSVCGQTGLIAQCQMCDQTFCVSCWWKHSHLEEMRGAGLR